MPDTIPSLTKQGHAVRFIESNHELAYNSGLALVGGSFILASRTFNPAKGRCEIILNRLHTEHHRTRMEPIGSMGLPSPGDSELEDCRLIRHDGRWYAAYTEGHYKQTPFLSIQRLALLKDDLTFEKAIPLKYGTNGRTSEKNWQFFSHKGGIYFTHSINPHVVAAVDGRDYRTAPSLHWPYGTMSGGTPPIRVGDVFVSFFHSYTRHPDRHRRYTMSAYCFEATSPFRIVGITRPLLRGSAEDPTGKNPKDERWNPIVVFPVGAHFIEPTKTWVITAGVNDSFDALITIPHAALHFLPIEAWAKDQVHYFRTVNPSLPVKVASREFVNWERVAQDVGILKTANADVLANIDGRMGVEAIDKPEYEALKESI